MTFLAHTGLGGDNVSPRAFARLSDSLLQWLCLLFAAAERFGCWPLLLRLVVIVLLPKPDGGRRPIGLFPTPIRIWMRARSDIARRWDSAMPRLLFMVDGEWVHREPHGWWPFVPRLQPETSFPWPRPCSI